MSKARGRGARNPTWFCFQFIAGINDVGLRLFWSATCISRFVLLFFSFLFFWYCVYFLLNQVEIQLICFGFGCGRKGKYAKGVIIMDERWMFPSHHPQHWESICWASKATEGSTDSTGSFKSNKCKTHSGAQSFCRYCKKKKKVYRVQREFAALSLA